MLQGFVDRRNSPRFRRATGGGERGLELQPTARSRSVPLAAATLTDSVTTDGLPRTSALIPGTAAKAWALVV